MNSLQASFFNPQIPRFVRGLEKDVPRIKKTLGEEKNAQLEDMISQRLDLENQLLIFAESDSGVSMILQWRIPQ